MKHFITFITLRLRSVQALLVLPVPLLSAEIPGTINVHPATESFRQSPVYVPFLIFGIIAAVLILTVLIAKWSAAHGGGSAVGYSSSNSSSGSYSGGGGDTSGGW